MPHRTGPKRHHRASEPGFLALRRHPLIHAVPEPHVRVHVPRIEEDFKVGSEFDVENVHVRGAVPFCGAGGGETVES